MRANPNLDSQSGDFPIVTIEFPLQADKTVGWASFSRRSRPTNLATTKPDGKDLTWRPVSAGEDSTVNLAELLGGEDPLPASLSGQNRKLEAYATV